MGKVLKNVIVVILVLLILAGVAAGGYALGKKGLPAFIVKPECEHEYVDGVCTKCGEEEAEEEPSGMIISTGNNANSRISLTSTEIPVSRFAEYGISPQAESGRQITATVTPVESEIVDFTWTAAFENPNSAWAKGKNFSEYFNIEASAGDPLSATAVCYQAFGEPIIITCTYDHDARIKDTCRVDYISRANVWLEHNSLPNEYDAFNGQWDGDYWLELGTSYGVGTVQGEITVDYAYFELTSAYTSAFNNTNFYKQWLSIVGDELEVNFSSNSEEALYQNTRVGRFDYDSSQNGFCVTLTERSFISDYHGRYYGSAVQSSAEKYLLGAFREAAEQCKGSDALSPMVKAVYTFKDANGKVIYTQNLQASGDGCSIDPEEINSPFHMVTGIHISDSNLYF